MRIITTAFLVVVLFCFSACRSFGKKIKGNGNMVTETREVSKAERLSLRGNFDVVLTRGAVSLKVTADENLMEYIVIEMDDNTLVIRSKEKYNLSSNKGITVYVSTPDLREANVFGSGNIKSDDKFVSTEKITLKATGSGDIAISVNSPDLYAGITGSGDINVLGETKNLKVSITGSGNFDGQDLKSENADVAIAGSGNATLFADVNLKARITGSGDIKYKGNAAVTSRITGSGTVSSIN